MTNEFVVGQNRYDPIFGQPASLDKISFATARRWTTPSSTTSAIRAWSAPGRWWTTSPTSAARTPSSSASTCAASAKKTSAAAWPASMPTRKSTSPPASTPWIPPPSACPPISIPPSTGRIFQSHINFLLGRVGQIDRGFVAQGDQWTKSTFLFDTRYPEYEFYAQDTWKVRPNLTVDLGLRYEIRLSPNTPTNNILVPNQPMVAGAAPSNTVQWVPGNLFKNQFGNFGPSLGFAWDPFGTGKTSIRANYRIAYDRINNFVIASTILPNLPGAAFAAINTDFGQGGGRLANLPALNPPTAKPSSLHQPAAFSSASNTVIDPNLKTPRTHQWALNIQREVARNTIVDIAYIGRRAYHLLGAYNVNQTQIFTNGFLDAFNIVKARRRIRADEQPAEGRYAPQRGRDRLADGAPPVSPPTSL